MAEGGGDWKHQNLELLLSMGKTDPLLFKLVFMLSISHQIPIAKAQTSQTSIL